MKAALVINRASAILKEIFSEQLNQQIRVKKFSNGVLWCTVNHSIVAQEMQLKSFQIMEKLNESLGDIVVKQIRTYQETISEETY